MRMFLTAYSSATLFVRPITACLLATYAEMPGMPTIPPTLATLTIAPPPPCKRAGISACIISQEPFAHVCLHHTAEILFSDVEELAAAADTGIVDGIIKPAVMIYRDLNHSP